MDRSRTSKEFLVILLSSLIQKPNNRVTFYLFSRTMRSSWVRVQIIYCNLVKSRVIRTNPGVDFMLDLDFEENEIGTFHYCTHMSMDNVILIVIFNL